MSVKKVLLVMVVLFGMAAFAAMTADTAQAHGQAINTPPTCYPINFFVEGYWGVECVDANNNIAFAKVKTDGVVTYLRWDNSSAQIIVQADANTHIEWQVCDTLDACTGGVFPK